MTYLRTVLDQKKASEAIFCLTPFNYEFYKDFISNFMTEPCTISVYYLADTLLTNKANIMLREQKFCYNGSKHNTAHSAASVAF